MFKIGVSGNGFDSLVCLFFFFGICFDFVLVI